jgi:hypothetical protein
MSDRELERAAAGRYPTEAARRAVERTEELAVSTAQAVRVSGRFEVVVSTKEQVWPSERQIDALPSQDLGGAMFTIILDHNGFIEVMYVPADPADPGLAPHIVVVSEPERWTDSPSIFTPATEAEQAEQVAAYRNDGFEDRNP